MVINRNFGRCVSASELSYNVQDYVLTARDCCGLLVSMDEELALIRHLCLNKLF